MFSRVEPRLAVYSHAPNSEALVAQTRKNYAGPLQGAEDLLTIDVGEQISVRRFAEESPGGDPSALPRDL